jgi:hypothetical protein
VSYTQEVRGSNPLPPTVDNDITFQLIVRKFFFIKPPETS